MGTLKKSALCVCLALVGCNENDDDNYRVTGNLSPLPMTITSASTISIDPTVSALTAASIQKIVSPQGTVFLGSAVPALTRDESIVLALDSSNNIRMAGFATGGQNSQLTAESTALALVRLAIKKPDEISTQQFNARIKSSASFSILVKQINDNFNSGSVLTSSEPLLKNVLTIVQQAVSVAKSPVSKTMMNQSVGFLTIDNAVYADNDSPFPYTIIPKDWFGSVTIDESKNLENTMTVGWSIQSQNYQGKNIGQPLLLPAVSGIVSGQFAPTNVIIPDDEGKSFSLTVEQNLVSRNANMKGIIADLINEVVPMVGSKCVNLFLGDVVLATGLYDVASNPSSNAFTAYLGTGVVKAFTTANVPEKCFANSNIRDFFTAKIGYLLPLIKAIDKIYSGASIAERVWMTAKYWDSKEKITVCMGRNGKIVNCAVRFELVPKDFVMVLGDKYRVDFKAFDDIDQKTLLPSMKSLEILDTPELLFVGDELDKTQIMALAIGQTTVTVKDITTGKISKQNIRVINPNFEEDTYLFGLDIIEKPQALRLKTKDAQGKSVSVSSIFENPNPLFTFSSSDPKTIEIQDGLASLSEPKLAVAIKAKKAGEAKIIATNNLTGHKVETTVIVSDYIMLNSKGEMLSSDYSEARCIQNIKTKTTWEIVNEGVMTREQANTFPSKYNTQKLCGKSSWKFVSPEYVEESVAPDFNIADSYAWIYGKDGEYFLTDIYGLSFGDYDPAFFCENYLKEFESCQGDDLSYVSLMAN